METGNKLLSVKGMIASKSTKHQERNISTNLVNSQILVSNSRNKLHYLNRSELIRH